jgi:hypothetical protein
MALAVITASDAARMSCFCEAFSDKKARVTSTKLLDFK